MALLMQIEKGVGVFQPPFLSKWGTGMSPLQFPIENVPPYRVPGHPAGKADGLGGGEKLLRHEQLRRLWSIPQSNHLVLVGVLTPDHQHRDAVDEKDDSLPRAIVAAVKGPLLGDFVNIPASR